jgi:hypothetical protein
MRSRIVFVVLGSVALVTMAAALMGVADGDKGAAVDPETSRIVRGYQIAPVPLNLRGKDRALVGLGSYLVNSVGGCNDCHTNPSYAPGGDPHQGQPEHVNADRYLAGGQQFGPFVSANITPDADGKPAGLTFAEFRTLLRTGQDPDEDRLLQVMPWPIYGKMSDRDLKAIYTYLSAIPHKN